MAEQDGAPAQRVDHRRHIRCQLGQRVGGDLDGLGTGAIAAHIHCGDAVAGGGEMRQLVPPAVGQFRPAMHTQDRQPIAAVRPGDHDIQRDRAVVDGEVAHAVVPG